MKTVLVVTYYWPPAGGVAVQRILKFCKYLPSCGWRPVVLTVRQGNYETNDNSVGCLDGSLYRARSLEPHGLYRLLSGVRTYREPSGQTGSAHAPAGGYKSRSLGELVRLNLFLPDARVGWYPFAWRLGRQILREQAPALIFSSAPPFTAHLVARRLAKLSGLPWVADFRDPWLENALYNKPTRWPVAVAVNRRLEVSVLRRAEAVTCVGHNLRALLKFKVPEREEGDIRVISNGYDAEDVTSLGPPFPRFVLAYFGSLYEQRFPENLFRAIGELSERDSRLKQDLLVRIHGHVTSAAREELGRCLEPENLRVEAPLPYQAYLKELYRPQVLLLSIDRDPHNELILLGKTFDYLPTGNPVLGVGPVGGDAAKLLNRTDVGEMFDYADVVGIKAFVGRQHEAWRRRDLNSGLRSYPEYERQTLTRELASLFDRLAANAAEVSARSAATG
ncbi:MAG: glycosyltransferase [Gammaproteobacteria bacterium]|nr:glycosyltransferase [Gammaproteobacteria bacterium]